MSTREIVLLSQYEKEILDLIEIKDEVTYSDLQGGIQAIVLNIYREGQKAI